MAGGSAGQVIVLNGTTSAGKTTLATTLQSRFAGRGECWIVIGIDDFLGKLPFAWVQLGDHVGAHAEQGIVFERVDGGIERRIGPVGTRLLAAYRAAVGSAARAGLNVIVDEVLLSEDDWIGWEAELDGLDSRWVRVEVDLELLEARERERGDREIGMARAQHGVVHQFAKYAVEVDTGRMDADAAAGVVLAALDR
jgi:chloramphenicol 3-O phosphotransferase